MLRDLDILARGRPIKTTPHIVNDTVNKSYQLSRVMSKKSRLRKTSEYVWSGAGEELQVLKGSSGSDFL